MPFPTPEFNPLSLQTLPKKVIGTLAATVGFAVIGVINTASFVIDKTADLIAWTANDRREESWMPLLAATVILIYFSRLLFLKLLQEQQTQLNSSFSKEQIKAAMPQHLPQTKMPSAPASNAFPKDSEFAKNLQRAGRKLFEQNNTPTAFSPGKTPATSAPNPADPDDALLEAALKEVNTQPVYRK